MTATYHVGAPTIDGVLANIAGVLDALRPDGIDDLDWLVWRVETLLQLHTLIENELVARERVH